MKGDTNLRWGKCKHFKPKNLVEELRAQGFKPLVNIQKHSKTVTPSITKTMKAT